MNPSSFLDRRILMMNKFSLAALGAFALLLAFGLGSQSDAGQPDEDLVRGAMFDRAQLVNTALQAGADPNAAGAENTSALMWAAERGHLDIARILLEAKADLNRQNNSGLTALMLAARSGRDEIVKLLLAAGADANLKDKAGNTARKWAEMTNSIKVLEAMGSGK